MNNKIVNLSEKYIESYVKFRSLQDDYDEIKASKELTSKKLIEIKKEIESAMEEKKQSWINFISVTFDSSEEILNILREMSDKIRLEQDQLDSEYIKIGTPTHKVSLSIDSDTVEEIEREEDIEKKMTLLSYKQIALNDLYGYVRIHSNSHISSFKK